MVTSPGICLLAFLLPVSVFVIIRSELSSPSKRFFLVSFFSHFFFFSLPKTVFVELNVNLQERTFFFIGFYTLLTFAVRKHDANSFSPPSLPIHPLDVQHIFLEN